MFKTSHLDRRVVDLGLLIGLLKPEGEDSVSVNAGWFSDPVTEIKQSPTRVAGLLRVLDSLFHLTEGIEYTSLDKNETWYSIYSAWDNRPTGLCLVTPKADAASGAISLGLFNQRLINGLTISLYARLPLFYLSEGQVPQFIQATGLTEYQKFDIALDVYSASPVEGADSAFNLMSLAATVDFNDSFHTDCNLFFYEIFDLETRNKRPLPTPTVDAIVGGLGALATQGSYWLSSYIGDTSVTIGGLLSAAGLLKKNIDSISGKTSYSFERATFDELQHKGPTAALKDFLATLVRDLLETVAQGEEPLVALRGGGIYAAHDAASNAYGLRLQLPDYQLTAPDSSGPKVVVELGKWFTNEGDGKSWIQRISGRQPEPGVVLLFLKYDGTTLSTTSRFALNSVGLDLGGTDDAPLLNLNGVTLKGAELRAFLDSDDWQHGFAMRLDNLSLPMGPTFAEAQSGSPNSNVVAKNLLASSDGNTSGGASSVNPGFSAEAGYINGHGPLLEIFDPQGIQTDPIWFPIQRRFGPIDCRKVGLKVDDDDSQKDDPLLGLIFDGNVSLGDLDVYLDQLSLTAHLKEIALTSGYELDLQGMAVSFSNGNVDISAGLLKAIDDAGDISYNGEALIKTASLQIAALGSYCALPDNGGTSLFVFGVLNKPIGGPAFFYVTGLMAGFGYNRSLKIPAQDEVPNFPLLAGLLDPAAIGGSNPSPQDALTKLQDWVPVRRGEYWLAAGVQFTTYKIINTNALIVIEFGNDLAISVIGLSILKQPQHGNAYVYAELGIEVVVLPRQGEFKASAVLAPGSYVMTPEAHMTGGFAFYAWFGDSAHSGDFVFTLGGYHPAFQVPAHYPQEPRVGINWQISDNLTMVGTAYFALTPSAMMAGCGLQVTFHDGDLKAWLKAQADVLIFWKPFYVIADISISVGVSYRISLLFTHITVSAEVGADFHLWGPPIGGTVYIDWYIISFTIGFGADKHIPTEISWDAFKEMLPSKPEPQASDGTTNPPSYLTITNSGGMSRSHQEDGLTLWLVRAGDFKFDTGSVIPASAVVVESFTDSKTVPGSKVGIQRVNGGISPERYQSQQTLTILKLSSDGFSHIRACMATTSPSQSAASGEMVIDISGWGIEASVKNLPQAMWANSTSGPTIDADTATVAATVGVTMYPKEPVLTNCTPQMVIDDLFEDRTINPEDQYMLPLSQTQELYDNSPQKAETFADIASIADSSVAERRSAVLRALSAIGVNDWINDPLTSMAATPGMAFADEPMEGSTVLSPST